MSMEKITYLPNGQWKLEKMAWGHKDYALTSHGDNPYTDEEKQAHRDSVMAYVAEKGYDIKDIDGQPHILVHRGLNDREEIDPKGKGPNKIDFSNKGIISTTHNSIHTLERGGADEYAMDHGESDGSSFSFWVPLTHVIGHGPSINDDLEVPDYHEHVTISPGNFKLHEVRHFKYDKSMKPGDYGHYKTKPIKVEKY